MSVVIASDHAGFQSKTVMGAESDVRRLAEVRPIEEKVPTVNLDRPKPSKGVKLVLLPV